MSKRLIALSSAAIASVYGIGYVATQPAAASMASSDPGPVGAQADAGAPPASSPAASAAVAPPASASAASATPTSSGPKDGTYKGTGWSRHGSVSVSVTIKSGRIVSAPITGVTTRYSQSVIAGLPAAVVNAQTSRVNMVSGATDSSMAYESAVSQALSQAGGGSQSSATGATSSGSSGNGSVQVTGPNGTIYSNPPQGAGRRFRRGPVGSFDD